jgi:serine/threonine-protein kinase
MEPVAFGKYLLLERLAQGGMAEVFRAVYRGSAGFEKTVALKRILPVFHGSAEFTTMFIDEARLAASLTHMNIVQVFEFGEVDGSFYLTMELVEGADLGRLYEAARALKRAVPRPIAALVAAEAARGLAYAHDKRTPSGEPLGIVHRDVSPQNILVSYAGEVKVADFGIAKAIGKLHKTASGAVMGKIRYMSPEQITGEPLDGRSDVFALGTVLHELLAGQTLFAGDNPGQVADQVKLARVRPPSERAAEGVITPPELDRICLRALERDREARYARAAELARDLQTFVSAAAPGLTREDVGAWVAELAPRAAARAPRPATIDPAATTLATPLQPRTQLDSGSWVGGPDLPSTTPARRPTAARRAPLPLWIVFGATVLFAGGFVARSLFVHGAALPSPAQPVSLDGGIATALDGGAAPTLGPSDAERQRLLAALEALPQAEATWRGVEAPDYLMILSAVDAVACAVTPGGAPRLPDALESPLKARRLDLEAQAVTRYFAATGELPPRVAQSLRAFVRTRPAFALAVPPSPGWSLAGLAARLDPIEPRHRFDLLREMSATGRWRPLGPTPRPDDVFCERQAAVHELAARFPSPRSAQLLRYLAATPIEATVVEGALRYALLGAERDEPAGTLELRLRITNPGAGEQPLDLGRLRLAGPDGTPVPTLTVDAPASRVPSGLVREVRLRFSGVTDAIAEAAVLVLSPKVELAAYSEVLR